MPSAATDKSISAFLNASEGAVGYPRLLKEFAATLEEERVLKKLLKKLAGSGAILKLKGKRYAKLPAATAAALAAQTASASPAAPVNGAVKGKPKREESAGTGDKASASDGTLRARIVREGKFLFALVGDGKKKAKYVIPKSKDVAPKVGASVRIKPLDRSGPFGYPAARVLQEDKPSVEFAQVSRVFFKERGIPMGYPKRALQEAEDAPEPESALGALGDRVDLRGDYVVTIDPADAKDHDDAISLQKLPDGTWKVAVHIADVSEYVKLDGPLDEEALHRAYTQYLPWTAAPMLPQRLSGDLCSLLEGKDRFAFTCFMEVTPAGDLRSFEFHETLINVAKFYSYEEAQRMKEEGDKALTLLCEFTDLLFSRRKEEGYLEFNLPEPKVVVNAAREPEDIRAGVRLPSHGWVEECMLLANRACAQHIHKHKIPGLYRVHEQPDIEVVAELWSHEASLSGKVDPSGIGKMRETQGYLNPAVQEFYVKLLDPSRGALPPAVQRKILQSMKKAQYSASPLGHFALGWQYYAHFTSPIRRYADLWTHRMMKLYARGQKIPRPLATRAVAIAGEISEREIEVVKIERKAMRVATAWIFRNYVGREFIGEISGVEGFGFFVTVFDPYGEGMVPVARLRDDYYEKDPETGHLVGRRYHRRFELGQKVRVKVSRSDPFTGQVDFEYLGNPDTP